MVMFQKFGFWDPHHWVDETRNSSVTMGRDHLSDLVLADDTTRLVSTILETTTRKLFSFGHTVLVTVIHYISEQNLIKIE